ncbi:MAG TPA: FAD binding domain-containing protein [Chloroflexota bacterium]|jgi:4-hydroxybenzoyl-CoA reductase subunit beta|nr:FAD binding domain-containing protein [Chloroflexota bacterium]
MLRLPHFQYLAPRSLDEAAQLLAEHGPRAMVVAGGTDLWPNMKRRQQEPPVVIGLRAVPGLAAIGALDDGQLRLGATASLHQVASHPVVRERYPALSAAAGLVSTPHLRRMGTLGGNLCLDTRCTYYDQTYQWRKSIDFCLKKDGAICWVAPNSPRCWAVSSSDTAPVAVALRARLNLVSATTLNVSANNNDVSANTATGNANDGDVSANTLMGKANRRDVSANTATGNANTSRTVDAADFFRDDGMLYLTRRPNEILASIDLPNLDGWQMTYEKLRRRGSFDFPILGVAAAVKLNDGLVEDIRLVLGAVGSAPVDQSVLAVTLVGSRPSYDAIQAVAAAAYKGARPLDNTDLNYAWRKKMTRVYVERALARVCNVEIPPAHDLA